MANVAYIVGGTGTLGSALVKRLYGTHEIHVLSRDECKQKKLKDMYPSINTHIVDIKDRESLNRMVRGISPIEFSTVYHCAALKHVDVGEMEVEEFVKTNYHGLINSYDILGRKANKFVFFTTDKAVFPINAYGMSKALSEKYLLSQSMVNIEIYRWGNIIGSRGSIIEKILHDVIKNKITTITNLKMTRYWYKIDDAIDFVLRPKISSDLKDGIYIPQDMRSASNRDLIECIERFLGLQIKYLLLGKLRAGEKMHENIDSYTTSEMQEFESWELEKYLHPEIKRIWGELNARI